MTSDLDSPPDPVGGHVRGSKRRQVPLTAWMVLALGTAALGITMTAVIGNPDHGWFLLLVAATMAVLCGMERLRGSKRAGLGCLTAPVMVALMLLAIGPYGMSWTPVQAFRLRFAVRHNDFDAVVDSLRGSGASGVVDGALHVPEAYRTAENKAPSSSRLRAPTSVAGLEVLATSVSPTRVSFCIRGVNNDQPGTITQCTRAFTWGRLGIAPVLGMSANVDCSVFTYELDDDWTFQQSECSP